MATRAFIRGSLLGALGDRTILRDPRGRSPRPSLVPSTFDGERGVSIRGPFKVLQSFVVSPAQGLRFVEATGDENPIHREGDIVPGALTASKLLAPLELLFPGVAWREVEFKFTGIGRYDRTNRLVCRAEPTGDGRGLVAEGRVLQEGEEIASAEVRGEVLADPGVRGVKRRKVDVPQLRTVRDFFSSLNILSRPYFHKPFGNDWTYPHAFMVSLPSGEMVRRLRGEGGILNKLSLELPGVEKIPITASPEVHLEEGRSRMSFQRVMAWIKEGLETYYEGSALVLPGARLEGAR